MNCGSTITMDGHITGYSPNALPDMKRLAQRTKAAAPRPTKASARREFISSRHTACQTVHFEFVDASAQKVCLAGTFNNWKPETGRMKAVGNGKWVKDLALPPGTYEYRLVVDDAWRTDPNADHTVVNPFGERNSLVSVLS
jgi:1,4-alpha-glucan branching enzyme